MQTHPAYEEIQGRIRELRALPPSNVATIDEGFAAIADALAKVSEWLRELERYPLIRARTLGDNLIHPKDDLDRIVEERQAAQGG